MATQAQTNGHQINQAGTQRTNLPNGSHNQEVEDEEVTKALADFFVHTSTADISSDLSTKLKALLLDYLGVAAAAGHAAESSDKFLKGILAFSGSATGSNSVLTKGSSFPPQYAALLNGALSHTYDFDDTHKAAILHPGSSVISAALAQAETQYAGGSELLLALAVGYEVACRLGTALGFGSYKRGFHNTGTVGIFGAVAAVCKLRKSSQQVIEDAFGLALSKSGGSMQFLENGSWNKRLHPGFAAHDALLCVSLAEAGVLGATKPIEGKYGLLHNFSESSNPANTIIQNLGQEWTFLDTACKPYPACRMTHGQIEMAGKLHTRYHISSHALMPRGVTIWLSSGCYPIVGTPSPNKLSPNTIVDAQFSTYFQTAAAWLHGDNLGWAVYEHIMDEDVQESCRRITVKIDEAYTDLESRMEVVFEDGSVVRDEILHPLAEPVRPFEWDTVVQRKFLGLAEPVYGKTRAEDICRMVDGIDGVGVVELMRLVA